MTLRPHRSPFSRRALAAALLSLTGCVELEEVKTGKDPALPYQVVTAFRRTCADSGCHTATARAGGLSLEEDPDADNVIPGLLSATASTGQALVKVGDLCGSYMALKLLPDKIPGCDEESVGETMPNVEAADRDAQSYEDTAVLLAWLAGLPLPEEPPTSIPPPEGDCSYDATAPQVVSPYDAAGVVGAGAGQIPTDIAGVLENNCGCHLVYGVDAPQVEVPAARLPGCAAQPPMGAPPGPPPDQCFSLYSFDALHTDNTVAGVQNWEIMRNWILRGDMPLPTYCAPKEIGALTYDDHAVLTAWLSAGAPDGASWDPACTAVP